MIKFKKLSYKNFLSTGNNATEIDLCKSAKTLIIGTNGCGKSSFLDAISFALFGKPHRSINKPQLLNAVNEKNLLVEIFFDKGSDSYHIRRGMKPGVFEIFENGVLLNQESTSRDYQKVLENQILQFNHKSFHQTVVLGASNFVPFMQLTPYARREVIEDLLDISVFGQMSKIHKEKVSSLDSKIQLTNEKIKLMKEKVSLQNSHITKIKKINNESDEKKNHEIKDLQKQIELHENERASFLKTLSREDGNALAGALEELKKRSRQLIKLDSQIEGKLNDSKKNLDFFKTTSVCPTCEQSISDGVTKKHVCESKERISKFSSGLLDLSEKQKKLNDEITALETSLKERRELLRKIESCDKDIGRLRVSITKLQKREKYDMSDALTSLNDFRDELDKHNATAIENSHKKHYYLLITDLLKDSGIKTKIIQQYLPLMNKSVNKYLSLFDFFVLFHLDENFQETIRSNHRDNFSYGSFSEGEKMKIDLALMFSWRQLASMKNSVNTNLLVLDEIFDSSLDNESIDSLLQILSEFSDTSNVFVISHKREQLENKFDSILEFEKVNNFSRLKNN